MVAGAGVEKGWHVDLLLGSSATRRMSPLMWRSPPPALGWPRSMRLLLQMPPERNFFRRCSGGMLCFRDPLHISGLGSFACRHE
jgi:hypothetical protein